jgi:outer membrane protein OmpA-like peptidoglycan-associated protein
VWLGVHLAFGARGARPAAAPPPPPAEKPAPAPIVREAKAEPPPRSDRDEDGVYDDEDACPDVRGVRTDDPKTNGCPPPEGPVHLEGDKIEIDDVILFALDDPRVHPASYGLVKKVAKFIVDNTDMQEIDIDGHADETGSEAYNVKLSAARARSVRALLVEYGVPTDRVTTHAFGESRPRDPGHTAAAYRQNRRVEFNVVKTRDTDEKSHEQAQQDQGQQDQQEQEKGR